MDIKDVFDVYPKSSWTVLCAPAVGFYIPPYQRFYSWDRSNIDRIFEDIAHGAHVLLERDDCITFIGTIIVIHDQNYETVAPQHEGELPSKVLLVIDGQQRLSTLLMLNAILHDEVLARSSPLDRCEDEALKWIANESKKLCANLLSTFQQDMTYGDGVNQFYPRIIRAYEDCWSRKQDDAIYSSPVPRFLFSYIKHLNGDGSGRFKYEPEFVSGEEQDKHKVCLSNMARIRSHLGNVAKEKDKWEFPSITEISASETLQTSLLNQTFPSAVRDFLSRDPEGLNERRGRALVNLIVFGRYALDRMAVTEVTAKNEDYAFDMFEALNTTGEPLTAFETFRPRVVEREGLAQFENSESRKHLAHVEKYLERYSKAEERQRATSEILIPFALSESGKKLSKRLNDQRSFLRDSYNNLETQAKRRCFTENLGHIALFVKHAWDDGLRGKPTLPGKEVAISDRAVLCLDVLRRSNHNITISVLSRFFSEWRTADASEADERYKDLEEAIFAVTAFFALWRGSRRGTAGIDGCYRALLGEGVGDETIPAFCRQLRVGKAAITVGELKTAFKHFLETHDQNPITSKSDWVSKAKDLPIYKNSQPLSRLLLLAAAHDTDIDPEAPGLLKKGRTDSLPLLNYKEWSEQNLTVEHVAPTTKGQGWEAGLYEDEGTIHRLGNLVLLPGLENSAIGNNAWEKKKLFYQLLAARTQDVHDELLTKAEAQGLQLSDALKGTLQKSKHIPHVTAVSKVEGDWNEDLIDKRGQRLCELAFDRFAGWIGF